MVVDDDDRPLATLVGEGPTQSGQQTCAGEIGEDVVGLVEVVGREAFGT